MKTWVLIAISLLMFGCNDSVKRSNKAAMAAVDSVDVQSYLGDWWVAAKMPAFFEKDCQNSRASYELADNGRDIKVLNVCESIEEPGKLDSVPGKGTPLDETNAKLKITLDRFPGNLFPGDYWVVNLDPEYQWAIVSEPKGRYLWILTRERVMNPSTLRQLVQWVEDDGWDMSQLKFDNGNEL